ncbi:MAG: T9SS type A sorting domain-containing protein [Flavobacteriales bacterium]|nr:T9SS type A sorting domain-containing protein [Flavobacteriales bacterium]
MLVSETLPAQCDHGYLNVASADNDNTAMRGMAVDKNGNAYMTGDFNHTLTIDGFTKSSTKKETLDIFLAKFDPQGKCLWLKSAGGTLDDKGYDVTADTSSVYITGSAGFATFDSLIVNPDRNNFFLAKYTSSGELQWVRTLAPGFTGLKILHSNTDNTLLVGGSLTADTLIFAGDTIRRAGRTDIGLFKYDPDGNEVWGMAMGGPSDEGIWYMDNDKNDNIYLTGSFKDSTTLGNFHFNSDAEGDGYITKITKGGSVAWAKKIDIPGKLINDFSMKSLEVDDYGKVYLTGKCDFQVDFGGCITSNVKRGAFIVKMDTTGQCLSLEQLPDIDVNDIKAPSDKDLIITGTYNQTTTVWGETLAMETGQPIEDHTFLFHTDTAYNADWLRTSTGGRFSAIRLSLLNNNIYMAGGYGGMPIFQGYQVPQYGKYASFIAKVNTYGELVPSDPAGPDQTVVSCDSATLGLVNLTTDIYAWAPNINVTDTSSGIVKASPLNDTWYHLSIQTPHCTFSDSVHVSVVPITVSAMTDTSITCGKLNMWVSTNAIDPGIQWLPSSKFNNSTVSNPVATLTDTTLVRVQITNGSRCPTVEDSVQVNVAPIPQIDILGPDTVHCGLLTLNAGTGYTYYKWSNGSLIRTTNVVYPGMLSLEVRDDNGCPIFDSLYVNIIPVPNLDLGNDIVLCDTPSVSLTHGIANHAAYTYLWSTGETTDTISVDTSGTYGILVQDTTGHCNFADSIHVSFGTSPKPSILVADSGVTGVPLMFINTTTDPYATCHWYFSDDWIGYPCSDTIYHTFTDPDTYRVCLDAWDLNFGCSSSTCDSIRVLTGLTNLAGLNNQTRLFPNPATDHVSLSTLNPNQPITSVDIYQPDGKLILGTDQLRKSIINLDVTRLPSGLYIVFAYHDSTLLGIHKFSVQR